MTRPVWRPHQVRQQLDTQTAQAKTAQVIRGLPQTPAVGLGAPDPNLASLLFHWPSFFGAITSGMSDPLHARWASSIAGARFDVVTFGGDFTVVVYVNGTAVPGLTCHVTGPNQGFLCAPLSIIPTDLVTVNATDPGEGNIGVVAHVELIS